MKDRQKNRKNRGIALVIAMVFIAVFSAFSIGMLSLAGSNVQLADNLHKGNLARSCAESGLDYVRYQLSWVSLTGDLSEEDRYETLIYYLPGKSG